VHADTPHARARRDEGFTLIEVLIAMLILSIGLLGLEALGIGATRATALAAKQSRYSTVAASAVEELRNGVMTNTAGFVPANASPVTPISNRRVMILDGDTAVVTGTVTRTRVGQASLVATVAPVRAAAAGQVRARSVTLNSFIWSANIP
jgi:prepilin-type N-terminal cleavage/methylation domain-containing protein